MDLLVLGILAVASAATCGLLRLCEWLSDETHGDHP
jgi:hypothetical protein